VRFIASLVTPLNTEPCAGPSQRPECQGKSRLFNYISSPTFKISRIQLLVFIEMLYKIINYKFLNEEI